MMDASQKFQTGARPLVGGGWSGAEARGRVALAVLLTHRLILMGHKIFLHICMHITISSIYSNLRG